VYVSMFHTAGEGWWDFNSPVRYNITSCMLPGWLFYVVLSTSDLKANPPCYLWEHTFSISHVMIDLK